jgi:hypothetical protein
MMPINPNCPRTIDDRAARAAASRVDFRTGRFQDRLSLAGAVSSVGRAGRLLLFVAALIVGLAAADVHAQGVNNMQQPQSGPQPVPSPFLNLPPLQFTFDQTLHPNAGLPGAPLSPEALQIVRSHNFARQQVRLALFYLLANEQNILSGRDELFNTHFGRFYDTNPATNQFLGQYQQKGVHALINPRPLSSTEAAGGGQQQGGGGGQQQQGPLQFNLNPPDTEITNPVLVSASAGENSVETSATTGGGQGDMIGIFLRLLRPGMRVYISDPLDPSRGELHTILQVIDEEEFTTVQPFLQDFDNVHLHLVVGEQERPLIDHYQRVVNTFTMIRDLLDRPVNYRGDPDDVHFAAFGGLDDDDDPVAGLFATGNATFEGLDLLLGRAADRALRQDGFSTSNSRRNIDIFNLLMNADPDNVMPLLWTEDNDEVFGQGDRIWFNNVLTIFGIFDQLDPLNGPIDQFVGRAFLEELRRFAGDFAGGDPAVFGLQFDPITGRAIANTGTPRTERTMQQWQMILQSFSEWTSDFARNDVAVLGLSEIQNSLFPEGSPQFFEGQAAGSYAQFAALFRDLMQGGMVPGQAFEPFGKRGTASFFPVIPDFVAVGPVRPVPLDPDSGINVSTGGGTGIVSPGGTFVPGTSFAGGVDGSGLQFGDPFAMPIVFED